MKGGGDGEHTDAFYFAKNRNWQRVKGWLNLFHEGGWTSIFIKLVSSDVWLRVNVIRPANQGYMAF